MQRQHIVYTICVFTILGLYTIVYTIHLFAILGSYTRARDDAVHTSRTIRITRATRIVHTASAHDQGEQECIPRYHHGHHLEQL